MTQSNPLTPSQEARSLLAVLNITVRDEDALVAIDRFEQAIRRDEAEQCIAAVRAERLTDPDFETSDKAYQRALDDAEAALRARHADQTGGK